LIEAPMGTTARELIDRCGGVTEGELLAFQPGGGATAFLGPEHLDIPMDFAHMARAGSGLGTGTLIVLDEATCPLGVLARHLRFYARESCGWCTPCREGLPWAARILDALEAGTARASDLDVLRMTAAEAGPRGRTFCDLMGGAMAPLGSALARWGEVFEAHLHGGCRLHGRHA
jgi:NADH-quinone oxidoreductase subunit F